MTIVPISVNESVRNKVPDDQMKILNAGFVSKNVGIDDIVDHILNGHALNPSQLDVDERGRSIRQNNAFQRAQLVFLDIDNSVKQGNTKRRKNDEEGYLPFDRVVNDESIRKHAFLVYTTASHTKEWHRFRLVFCLPDVVTDVERYKQILRAFIEYVGADQACRSPVHIYYGNTDAEIHPFAQVLTSQAVDSILLRARHLEKEERTVNENAPGEVNPDHVRTMLSHIPPKIEYIDWVRVISGVASKLDEDTTVQLIEEWSPGSAGEVRYKVRHRLAQVGMGTVVYIAKQHGYQPARDLYQRASLEEEAGIIYPGLRYRLTQAGNGERFADKYRATVRYCPERNAWYIWDGRRLAIDQTAQITRMALQTFRDIIREAAEIESPKARESVLKWAKTSESKACIEASLSLAHPGTELAVSAEALDAKPMCINLQNGIFDLETMTLCAHDIEELHTRIIPIDYVEDAECPKWLAFLDRIFAGDEELIDFLQRAVGYTLSALTTEECLFFCYGSGANGKSIFFSVIDMLLGGTEGYAHKAKNDLVMLRKGDPGVPMDIAELKGKRFVYCDELPENRRFDESKIKDITSHDKLKGRYIFERPIEFMPTHKLWMYGNHRPIITGQDDGIWRRIHMVPFTVTIPEGERRPPEVLKSEFQAEAPGILRWALEGFYHWRHNGRLSRLPKCVRDATAEYQTEMDTIGSFIGEEVLETPGSRLPHKVLYNRYKQWCVENGVTHIMTSKKLSRHLRETKRWPSQLDRKESHEWINRQLNDHEQTTIF